MKDFKTLRQICGTCGHQHQWPDGEPVTGTPVCDCGCESFAMAAGDQAEIDQLAALEAGYLGAEQCLEPQHAAMLLRVLTNYESTGGSGPGDWDLPPVFGTLSATAPEPGAGPAAGQALSVHLSPARVPDYFWSQADGNPVRILQALAAKAALQPAWFDWLRDATGLGRGPALAWFSILECYELCPVEPGVAPQGSVAAGTADAADEVRSLIAADVDGRIYEVTRSRNTGRVVSRVRPARRIAEAIAGVGPLHPDIWSEDGLPPMMHVLLELTRLSAAENELRWAFRDPTSTDPAD